MPNELLIMRRENKILSLQVQEGKICQIHAEGTEAEPTAHLGDIYVGKVRNIVKNINAAFVEFQKGQIGYLSLSDSVIPIHTQGVVYQEGRVLIGDEIMVQVAKEAIKTKPPTLSGALDLTGRYVVLTVGRPQISISKKIREKAVREELSEFLAEFACDAFGFIARTNSAEVSKEVLQQEIQSLIKSYEEIMEFGIHRTPYSCLLKAPAGYLSHIRDGYIAKVERILTDDEELYQEIEGFLKRFWPEELHKLERWKPENGKLDAVYNVSRTIDHALMPKVWLKSGAYLVIQPTEALVSIDVNTGKAISKKKDVQQTYLKVNKEAAQEIAHQLRLRNLSGMILIDFIDMKSEEAKLEVIESLRQAVRQDPVKTTVVDMTKLGLVEVTRMKLRKSLFEQLKE